MHAYIHPYTHTHTHTHTHTNARAHTHTHRERERERERERVTCFSQHRDFFSMTCCVHNKKNKTNLKKVKTKETFLASFR